MSEDRPTSRITPEEDLLIVETPAVLSNKFYVCSAPGFLGHKFVSRGGPD